MMWIKLFMLALVGLGGGIATAAGYFALIASIGIITRMADKTHTGKFVRIYENMLILGASVGNGIIVYGYTDRLWNGFAPIIGLCSGIFVGCFLISLAEAVKGMPIFFRRIRLSKWIGFVLLSFAIGKSLGSLLYFLII